MTKDQLRALAERLRDHAAMHDSVVPCDDEQRQWRDDLLDAAEYLRQCAQADAVETLQKVSSEHDIGYAAGWRNCADEATRIVASHIDRLEPGRQQRMRDALLALLASMRSILVVQRAVFAAPQPPSAQADAIEALRMALDALSCTGESDDPGHRCTHCDDYVDRNSVVRKLIRAVLAAQGGNDD